MTNLCYHEDQNPNGTNTETLNDSGTIVTFDLSGECLGVEVQYVREILDKVNVNRLPSTSCDIEGVIDIRGESIPIIDMGSILGLPRLADGEDTRIIVFEVGQDLVSQPIGVFADRVRDVTRISKEQIEYSSENGIHSWNSKFLTGLARHDDLLILLLDMKNVFDVSNSTVSAMSGFEL